MAGFQLLACLESRTWLLETWDCRRPWFQYLSLAWHGPAWQKPGLWGRSRAGSDQHAEVGEWADLPELALAL